MIYQIDGIVVAKKPTGKFKKIVEVPGILRNYLTKKSSVDILKCTAMITTQFFTQKTNHIAITMIDGNFKVYLNGKEL